ncbi:hypothetical protein BH09CHL1_BH09CHL1_17920 [soil metagenome]
MPSFSFRHTNPNVYHNSVGDVPCVGPFSGHPNSVEKGNKKGLPYGWLMTGTARLPRRRRAQDPPVRRWSLFARWLLQLA